MKYKIGDLIRSSWLNSVNGVGVVTGTKMYEGILVYCVSYIDSVWLTIYTYECSASMLMSHPNNIYEI